MHPADCCVAGWCGVPNETNESFKCAKKPICTFWGFAGVDRPPPPHASQTSITLYETRSPNRIKTANVHHWGLVHCQQDVAISMAAPVTMTFGWRCIVADWPPRLRLIYSEEIV